VRELLLSLDEQHLSSVGMDSSIPLLHFLSSSPSLKSLIVTRDSTAPDIKYRISTVYILQAISRNKLLVKLKLSSLVYAKPSLIEEFLAKTLTLEELIVVDSCEQTSEVYHAFRRGFEQNHSLEQLYWRSTARYALLEEVFSGISNHPKLKALVLDMRLTRASSQALRSCLHANGALETICLILDKYSMLEPVLLGLACNRGVTHFHIKNSSLSLISCAMAWVELLQKNTSIKILELSVCSIGRDDMSAIARGLEGNASLEKLKFTDLRGWLDIARTRVASHDPAKSLAERDCPFT
jgi:hypothetical protein